MDRVCVFGKPNTGLTINLQYIIRTIIALISSSEYIFVLKLSPHFFGGDFFIELFTKNSHHRFPLHLLYEKFQKLKIIYISVIKMCMAIFVFL